MHDTMIAIGKSAVGLQNRMAAMLDRAAYQVADIDWTKGLVEKIGRMPFMYQSAFIAGLQRVGVDDQLQRVLRGLEEYTHKGMSDHPKQEEAQRMVSELRRTWDVMCGRT